MVEVYDKPTREEFLGEICPGRKPAVLRGLDLGSCTTKWTVEYLCERLGDAPVKVHVAPQPCLDFVSKNFAYRTMPMDELIRRASGDVPGSEFYYLRSLGADARAQDVADVRKQFPDVADDVQLPPFFSEDAFFSSVLRVGSPGLRLWTHYDVMDNFLVQVRGRKRVLLFAPDEALNMYLVGDKSAVLDVDHPDPVTFPRFLLAHRQECLLQPGDVLYIPALWFHNTLALDFGVAVNVFWRHLPRALYDKKDTYGNKDVLPAARVSLCRQLVVKCKISNLRSTFKTYSEEY